MSAALRAPAARRAPRPPDGGAPALVPALAAALLVASGCAALAPAERPLWEGRDQVGDVAPERLVGTWRVTPLNPYPDQATQSTVIEYRRDGSVVGQIAPSDDSSDDSGGNSGGGSNGDSSDSSGDESATASGEARFEIRGRWTLADGIVSHADLEVRALSDDAMARLVADLINGTERDLAGTADIQQIDAERIVMLGTDGAAVRYERQ